MSIRSMTATISACGVCLSFTLPATAQIQCWAPGMSAPVILTGNSRYQMVSLGRPFRYDVYGVAGRIELGDKAYGAAFSGGTFKQTLLNGLLGNVVTNNAVDSTAYVLLQTGSNIYPEALSVKGGEPGIAMGPVHRYGPNWTLADPRNPTTVNLVFHTAGSTLLQTISNLLLPSYYNLNPKGYFYVLGVCHEAPPDPTGTLSISNEQVLVGCPVTVSYQIDRHDGEVYRPPFVGLDLGDTNLTVLGSPPAEPPPPTQSGQASPSGSGPVLEVDVTIQAGAGRGEGWVKVTVNG